MNLQQLAIATISWARDKDEEELLRQSLTQLSSLGASVFITDGGSPEGFVKYISGLSGFTVLQPATKGLWEQAKKSLDHAYESGAAFVLYTEPDKLDFFKQMREMLGKVQPIDQIGIVLASRSEEGMATFPKFQQMTEATINNCCAELIGKHFDYTYGPFLINRKVISQLQNLPGDIGWGWRPFAFNIAARMGLQVDAFIEDYQCPKDQQQDDANERIYRMKQLTQNIQGLVLSATAPLV